VPWGTDYRVVFREEEKGRDDAYLNVHRQELIQAVKELLCREKTY